MYISTYRNLNFLLAQGGIQRDLSALCFLSLVYKALIQKCLYISIKKYHIKSTHGDKERTSFSCLGNPCLGKRSRQTRYGNFCWEGGSTSVHLGQPALTQIQTDNQNVSV